RLGRLHAVRVDHVQQHDLRLGLVGRGVHARRPGALGQPDDDLHGGTVSHVVPETVRTNHSAATPASRPAGTVRTPRRRNSRTAGGWSRACRICRHNRVASDPTYVRLGPRFTPSSTARTRPGEPATSGTTIKVAGRLFTRFASTAASTAAVSRPAKSARSGTSARTAAPAAAIQTGATPTGSASPNPTSVAARTPSANHGVPAAGAAVAGPAGAFRSSANAQRKTAYSTPITTSQGSAITAANPA